MAVWTSARQSRRGVPIPSKGALLSLTDVGISADAGASVDKTGGKVIREYSETAIDMGSSRLHSVVVAWNCRFSALQDCKARRRDARFAGKGWCEAGAW
jgi:hypothetical protein